MEELKRQIDELITDYLTGSLDAQAAEELKKWRTASAENERYFLRQRELWFSAMNAKEASRFDAERAFEVFKSRVARQQTTTVRPIFGNWWRYAAAVAILLLTGTTFYWWGGRRVKDTFADIAVEAPWGSRTKLHLPDGTLVWLNAGSRMIYSQGFGVSDRVVELEGEGYFEVTRNEEIPFHVKTKELCLKVLGTKFNFRDYPDDREVVVSLVEGGVELDNRLRTEKEIRLLPDQRAVLCKADGSMKVEPVKASNASEWTEGYLFFDEKLLPDIARELERSYNVQIHLADSSLNSFRFYGNFVRREQTIAEVMEVLASTGKIDYEMQGRDIIVSTTGFQRE